MFFLPSEGPNNIREQLSTSVNTVSKSYNEGKLFLGTFVLSKTPIPATETGLLSIEQVQQLVLEVRNSYSQTRKNVNQRITPPITLVRVSNSNKFLFGNYTSAGH